MQYRRAGHPRRVGIARGEYRTPSRRPCCGLKSTRHEQVSERLLSPNVRHTDIVPWCVRCLFRYYSSAVLYGTSTGMDISQLVYIMACRDYLNSVETRRYMGRCGSGWWPAWMKCTQASRMATLCFVFKLLTPGSLLLVAAGCSLRVLLPALTDIDNSRQGSHPYRIPGI